MDNRWYQNAVIYCVEIDVFRDGNSDGAGDFVGLTQGLAYFAGLGVNCVWLLPFYPSPRRGDGYDIVDHLVSICSKAILEISCCSWMRRTTGASASSSIWW